MKRVNPFPSLSLLLPDDVVEAIDSTVASYWTRGDTCLLQIRSFLREQGPQVSAVQRLSERTRAGGGWETVNLPHRIEGCDMAAASNKDDKGTSWVHVYLVWDWLAVHATVSHHGDSSSNCDWAWNALISIRPVVGDSDEADRHSELIAITVPGWIRSVVGAKRRWRMDFAESDRDRQACCC
jgi:hypothetical protein